MIYVGSVQDRLPYGAPKSSDVIAAREGYVVGFNDSTHNPDWCYEKLMLEMLKGAKTKRAEDFRHDAQIPRSAGILWGQAPTNVLFSWEGGIQG